MAKQTVNIKNNTGLHARPASEFVKLTSQMACEVFLEKDGRKANAKSILGVLSLAIGKGSEVDIITEGEGEDASLKVLVDFVEGLQD